jgi:hypothetical protein
MGVLGLVLRLALGLLAFALLLGALLVGAVLTLGLVAWTLLRGRRPTVQVFSSSFQRMRRPAADRNGGSGRSTGRNTGRNTGRSTPVAPAGTGTGTVIDIEAREVPDNGQPGATLQSER